MNEIDQKLEVFRDALKSAPYDFVFIGGSVLSLLVKDDSVAGLRTSQDVDVIVNATTLPRYHDVEEYLRSIGFRNDNSEGAPICRWIYNDYKIDVLPVSENVLKWKSKWFPEAFQSAEKDCVKGFSVVSAPYFIALKLEAFEDRGKMDFCESQDFEDIICVFNGRPGIVDEIVKDEALCQYLAKKFSEYIKNPRCRDAIEGFMCNEEKPTERLNAVMSAFKLLASYAAV